MVNDNNCIEFPEEGNNNLVSRQIVHEYINRDQRKESISIRTPRMSQLE